MNNRILLVVVFMLIFAPNVCIADVSASANASKRTNNSTSPRTGESRTNAGSRAEFSGKRMLVEMVLGGVVGSLAGAAVYEAAGGDSSVESVLTALGAQMVVTPAVVWSTGRVMGGQGTLRSSYLGGLAAFAGPAATPEQVEVSFTIGMIIMPITSALFYEISSHISSQRLRRITPAVSLSPRVVPDKISGLDVVVFFNF